MSPGGHSSRLPCSLYGHAGLRYRVAVFVTVALAPLLCTHGMAEPDDSVTPGESPPTLSTQIQSTALAPPSAPGSTTLFTRLPAQETGLDLVHEFPATGSAALLQDQGAGAGVCIGDFDGDGWPDVFVANYDRGNRLYRNRGGFRFEDVTARSGVGMRGRWCGGVAAADVDGDGDLDLAVAAFNAPNLVFLNDGNGVFREHARALGLDFAGASVMPTFGDYDLDGLLDCYLLTHRLSVDPEHALPRNAQDSLSRAVVQWGPDRQLLINPRFRELFGLMDKGAGRVELFIAGQADHLFHNRGAQGFKSVTSAAGIQGYDIGLSATWWDYNQDGWPDLYVSNDYKGPDRLYRNQGNGTFLDVARDALPHVPWSSMGADTADINNDGRMDFLATEMAGSTHRRRQMILDDLRDRWFLQAARPRQYARNALYLATGTEHLMEVAFLAGLAYTDWTWSPKFADFDNDGWVDLFVANGMSRDYVNADLLGTMRERGHHGWKDKPVLREANLAFRNLGDLRFASVGPAWGLDQMSASFGAAVADLDRDGDLDLIVTSLGEPVALYRNDEPSGHRVLLRLKGTRSNTWGVHGTVRLETEATTQTRCLGLTSGFMSANEPLIHFGLGRCRHINRLTVLWPSGHQQSFEDLPADRFYTVTEPDTTPLPRSSPSAPAALFRPAAVTEGLQHRETDYDDFSGAPLLPWKLSQFGPGLAVGDINGDDADDLFLGGAAGQAGQLAVRDENGDFRVRVQACFERDKACEDLGAVFLDADGDGDQDVYVASGGVECPPDDPRLRDRLYLNDGQGNFNPAPDHALPDLRDAGSVVAAADWDRDGDLDLFVGGRSVPGAYPLAAHNRLLLNEGGHFREVTEFAAPGLKESGLVTSAIWSDANGDGWTDLLITHEWGPVKLFLNEEGHLVDRTREAGLEDLTGWWNGIAAADVDSDGDMDYAITNVGLNTRYRASPERPALLFYGVFDESAQPRLVEATFDGETKVPLRSFNALAEIMPALRARFASTQAFAAASLETVLTPELLRMAQRFTANTLASGLLLNSGQAQFEFRPLPQLAQTAPAFGVVFADVDGDSHHDLLLAQNSLGPQPETGHMHGGLSLMLQGHGNGDFTPLWPNQSGILVGRDAKALVVADFNRDGWPDLIMAVNNHEAVAFENRAPQNARRLAVALRGRRGNPSGIGARVSLVWADGTKRVAEVQAGGGYLSQSAARLSFGLGATDLPDRIEVRWASGRTTTLSPIPDDAPVRITE